MGGSLFANEIQMKNYLAYLLLTFSQQTYSYFINLQLFVRRLRGYIYEHSRDRLANKEWVFTNFHSHTKSTKFQSTDLLFVLRNYLWATAILSLSLVELSLQSQLSALVWWFGRSPTIALIEKSCISGVCVVAFLAFGVEYGWNCPGRFVRGRHEYTWRS